jgi:hypothetical protein
MNEERKKIDNWQFTIDKEEKELAIGKNKK